MALIWMTRRRTICGCVRVLRKKIEKKYDYYRPTSYINNARIINSRIIWRWDNAGIENSRAVPKMREPGTLHTKIGARMGSFSCEDDKKNISQPMRSILLKNS